ncbi:MAG: BTAD domain-containing putative transcriptional regulator [Thermoanaerobaculia bacterium]
MSRLEIRLLGGFEAKLADRPVQRFESQKARALLGYLALHRSQVLPRDHLAGLFWPERPNEAARRNLRQAVYSIQNSLGDDQSRFTVFERERDQLRLHPGVDCWIDVEEFRTRVRRGLAESGPDPHQLTEAVRLYKGDLLAGFFLRGCVDFEEWLVTRQERIRDEALETFRTLIQIYLARGEHRFGIQYAKRLLAIDPLSEETHRQLMRLYLLAGRRNRALAQFEQLLNLLQSELGVDPVDETTELYRSILLRGGASQADVEEEETTPPIIPLIGRGYHFDRLHELWSSVLDGRGRFTVVSGESGVGKSRLVKSFIDGASSKRNAVVLRGRAYAAAPLIAFRPFGEAVRAVFADVLADEHEALSRFSPESLADLSLLSPELPDLVSGAFGLQIDPSHADSRRIAESFLELIDVVLHPTEGETRPVIFLLEDIQWADRATLALTEFLVANIEDRSMWLLATGRDIDGVADTLSLAGEAGLNLSLGRLEADEVHEIAKALVDLASASGLADYLWSASRGLPLAVAEFVNLLWDEKVLIQLAPGRWALRSDPTRLDAPDDIGDLIYRRFSRLPNSSRRLLSLAAVLGHQFDVDVLTSAAEEHLTVVETAIELALERWLIRQFPRSWSQAGPERDIVLWARGARRGFFEFSHRAIRTAILDRINPLRKRLMHAEAARAILKHHAAGTEAVAEELAFHYLEAGEATEARHWLGIAADRADRSGAEAIARWYRAKVEAIGDPAKIEGERKSKRGGVVSLPRERSPQK